jgi:hypothetical protein
VPSTLLLLLFAAQSVSWPDQLAQARAKWMAAAPADYEYTLVVSGLVSSPPVRCHVDGTGATTELLIKDGSSSDSAWIAGWRRESKNYCGMEKLFGVIETYLNKQLSQRPSDGRDGDTMRPLWHVPVTEYDSNLGFPTRVELDPAMLRSDDELRFRVQDFVAIRR